MNLSIPLFALGWLLWVASCLLVPRGPRRVHNGSHFEVKSLPDSPPLPPSWAGLIPVPGVEEGNSFFFWLFEAEDAIYDENLISKEACQ